MESGKLRIGIDISQIAHEHTGVAQFTKNLVENLVKIDKDNTYIFFGSSFRKKKILNDFCSNVLEHCNRGQARLFFIPPTLLDILWNKLHILPIEWLVGEVDVFLSSDWTQPPTRKAKRVTILYDLIVYKYPQETAKKIVETQKRRLDWVKKECDLIFCISEATKKDAMEILGIEEKRLKVIYPGI